MAWNPLKFLTEDDELPKTDSLLLKKIKLIIIGDPGVGKKELCRTFARSRSSTWDNFAEDVKVDGKSHDVMFINTTTVQEAFQQLKPIYAPKTQCILLCFSLIDRNSLISITSKWLPQVKYHCPQVPYILVGTKSDLRRRSVSDHITLEEGRAYGRKIEANSYIESSVEDKTYENVIETAVSVAITDSDNCSIM